jgi:N-acetylmuramoyl-L-alanine amidase
VTGLSSPAGVPGSVAGRRPPRGARQRGAVALVALVGLAGAGCTKADRVPTAVAQPAPSPTATPAPAPTTTRSPAGARPATDLPKVATGASRAVTTTPGRRPTPGAPSRSGLVVVLDPGHNGGNAAHPEIINRQVDAGRGQTKPCNTVGAETATGYPEHAFNFDVAQRTRRLLVAHGLTVLLTRPDDTGVGPCVDARARFGNAHGAAAVVSIHADGADPAGAGFHVIEAMGTPGGPAIAAATSRLALRIRAALLAESGFGYATYVAGGGGLDHRADLGGLNLSTRAAIFVVCGNMRNPADAARMTSPAGRQRIARALADGILATLGVAG